MEKGPRAVDNSGIPVHEDNKTVVKEQMFLSKTDPDILHNADTIIDNTFTRAMDGVEKLPAG